MCLQGGCSFPIFSSCGLPAVLCVCLLLMSETRCSAALLYSVAITPCRNISLCLSNQTCRPALSSKVFRPGFVLAFNTRENARRIFYTQPLFKTRIGTLKKRLRVWVWNATKIAAVLSASNHEKECCRFLSHHPVCGRFVLSCCDKTSQAYIKKKKILTGAVLCWRRTMLFDAMCRS